jgi:hypothetical protein
MATGTTALDTIGSTPSEVSADEAFRVRHKNHTAFGTDIQNAKENVWLTLQHLSSVSRRLVYNFIFCNRLTFSTHMPGFQMP